MNDKFNSIIMMGIAFLKFLFLCRLYTHPKWPGLREKKRGL